MPIFRQDEETDIPEIFGKTVRDILIVAGNASDAVIIMHLHVDDTWLRIFLDAGLLFVNETAGPDPEDDLEEGIGYRDVGAQYSLIGRVVTAARMAGGVFAIQFQPSAALTLTQKDLDSDVLLGVTHSESS